MTRGCPHCGASLQGGEIPEGQRDLFGGHRHFSLRIGVPMSSRPDYVGFFLCPLCVMGHRRWEEGDTLFLEADAELAEYNSRQVADAVTLGKVAKLLGLEFGRPRLTRGARLHEGQEFPNLGSGEGLDWYMIDDPLVGGVDLVGGTPAPRTRGCRTYRAAMDRLEEFLETTDTEGGTT